MGSGPLFGLSDCYCCWLNVPCQLCLLSAGLSSKIVSPFFFLWPQSYPPCLSDFCVPASSWQPETLLCAAGISSTLVTLINLKKRLCCWHFSRWLIILSVRHQNHNLVRPFVFLSGLNAVTRCSLDLDCRRMILLPHRSLNPSTEVC